MLHDIVLIPKVKETTVEEALNAPTRVEAPRASKLTGCFRLEHRNIAGGVQPLCAIGLGFGAPFTSCCLEPRWAVFPFDPFLLLPAVSGELWKDQAMVRRRAQT